MSILYIIGTPIGNLGDLSFRALETLKSVNYIACEDTRQTLKLLSHFDIHAKLISCRAQNEIKAAEKIIKYLDEGENIAYTSDAGTPGISDPGAALTRAAEKAGHQVLPVPGPSALATILSVAGGTDKTVVFDGFLSPKPGRRKKRLRELLALNCAFVLYESPFRIIKLLEDLADLDYERYICIGREMTKVHEEYLRGTVAEIYSLIAARDKLQGEFSVYVSGKKS